MWRWVRGVRALVSMRCLEIFTVVTLQHSGDRQHNGHNVPSHSRFLSSSSAMFLASDVSQVVVLVVVVVVATCLGIHLRDGET